MQTETKADTSKVIVNGKAKIYTDRLQLEDVNRYKYLRAARYTVRITISTPLAKLEGFGKAAPLGWLPSSKV